MFLHHRYLGSNSITVVEGLENLESLRELHIEKQSLPPGEKLLFEPRSLQAISVSTLLLKSVRPGSNVDVWTGPYSLYPPCWKFSSIQLTFYRWNKLVVIQSVADMISVVQACRLGVYKGFEMQQTLIMFTRQQHGLLCYSTNML